MQLEEMRGVGGCVGEGGGGGGREGKGRRENAVERGRETRHTPEKLSISSPLELFEPKGKTNKQNKQLNWRVSGALVCWVCAPEWDVCVGGAALRPRPAPLEVLRPGKAPLYILLAPARRAPPGLYFAQREQLPLPISQGLS